MGELVKTASIQLTSDDGFHYKISQIVDGYDMIEICYVENDKVLDRISFPREHAESIAHEILKLCDDFYITNT